MLKKILEHPIIATTIGAILATAISSTFGWLPDSIADSLSSLKEIISVHVIPWLASDFGIPIWLLITSAILAILIFIAVRRIQPRKEYSPPATPIAREPVARHELSEAATWILSYCQNQDATDFYDLRVFDDIGKSKIELELGIEDLQAAGLVEIGSYSPFGTNYYLTTEGKRQALNFARHN